MTIGGNPAQRPAHSQQPSPQHAKVTEKLPATCFYSIWYQQTKMSISGRKGFYWIVTILLGATFLARTGWALPLEERHGDEFRTQIEPLLAYHCYECHGPTSRKGGLRLSNAADAFRPGDFGIPVISSGSAELSPLMDMITSDDLEDRMPKDRPALSDKEIAAIRQWIDRGAIWPESANAVSGHWAYHRPQRPTPPRTGEARFRPIDQFVRARLDREGLLPTVRAKPEALVRRLHFDLTGLPPNPHAVRKFIADPSDAAWETLVDELLASPHFGEHWAVPWLDLARYADSTGFMSEEMLSNWPYRDWVVDAINDDMPFDQFSIEQIAGDLIPEATDSQKVATGFHRAAPLNLEAGVREEESRVTQVIDRVNTTSTIWLGATLSCAQCHDHKFDPISQEEYFRLLAFFNNTTHEAVSKDMMGGVLLLPRGPTLQLKQSDRLREQASRTAKNLQTRITNNRAAIEPARTPLPASVWEEFQERIRADKYIEALDHLSAAIVDQNTSVFWSTMAAGRSRGEWHQLARAEISENQPEWILAQPLEASPQSSAAYTIKANGDIAIGKDHRQMRRFTIPFTAKSPLLTALRLTVLAPPSPEESPLYPPLFVTEIKLQVPDRETKPTLSRAHATQAWYTGAATNAIDNSYDTDWFFLGSKQRKKNQSITLILDHPLVVEPHQELAISIQLGSTRGEIPQMNRKLRIETTGASTEVVALPAHLREEILLPSDSNLGGLALQGLTNITRALSEPDLEPIIASARASWQSLPPPPIAHILVEEPSPRETRIFERGDPHVPGEIVEAGTPAILHPFPSNASRNRLALARWIMAEENPLTARVTVNRWWGKVFGTPLVDTPDDFGIRGARPTHPELLDWLATELISTDWSRKALLRQMVLSETYRQSVVPRTRREQIGDPDNRLLTRSTRLRLNAETIRDNALQIAGLLHLEIGGAPSSPPQPPDVWRPNGTSLAEYIPSEGHQVYRRGLYTVARRSSPYPSMLNFDAGDRTTCQVERRITNTPLQALTILNDEVFSEAALAFASRLLQENPSADDTERLEQAFLIALSRRPNPEEIEILSQVLATRQNGSTQDALSVAELMAHPRFNPPADADAVELARWFAVGRILLNLDETLHRG